MPPAYDLDVYGGDLDDLCAYAKDAGQGHDGFPF